LLRSIAAKYGADLAPDLVADALTEAWEHWDRVADATNQPGYVYRIADRLGAAAVKADAKFPAIHLVADLNDAQPDIDLANALDQLSTRQRQVVMLIKAWGYSYAEVGELLGVTQPTLRNHLNRGFAKLREALDEGADDDA
jgi:RNA polymerase sigma factor (sigma-70 family)